MSDTVSDRVAHSVLSTCKQIDPLAQLSACSRDHRGRTLIHVNASATHTATELASALRTLMPLAVVRTIQDLRTGETVAKLVVPTAEDEWDLAHETAAESVVSRLLRRLSLTLLVLGVALWAFLALTRDNTTNEL